MADNNDRWHISEPAIVTEPAMSAQTPRDRHERVQRALRSKAVAGVALVAVGAAAGAGIGHAAWRSHPVLASTTSGRAGAGTGAPTGGAGELPGGAFGGPPTGSFPGSGGTGRGSGYGPGPAPGASNSDASDGPTDAAAIAHAVDAGIVDITTTDSSGEAAGTGMVLTSTGEVLTNNHVIDGATRISVRDVGNGKTYQARVVGYDRSSDIAVLQLSGASGLTTVTPAATEPSSGAAIVAIGNAGGLGGTPRYAGGAIIGTGKRITASDDADGTSETLTGLLATDAAIAAGDSGGPLVDSSGHVVGMDTAASSSYSSPTTTATRGFAIPIRTALSVAKRIESGQASSTVHVGPTAEIGVYVVGDQSGSSGARVAGTIGSGPAGKAGITRGDVIMGVDGRTVANADDLSAIVAELTPGQTVTVAYTTAAGERRTSRVTLATGAAQ
jgi:S1-C subfamily serine protease